MAVDIEVVLYKDGEAIEHLGEWNFHTMPTSGDVVSLIGGNGWTDCKVHGFHQKAHMSESVPKAPRSLGPENRPPKLMVEKIRYQCELVDVR